MRRSRTSSFTRRGVVAVAACLLLGVASVSAQGPSTTTDPAPTGTAAADPQPPVKPATAPAAAVVVPTTFERWVDLQTAGFQMRYRYLESSAGVMSANQGQDSVGIKARVKIDPQGRVSVTTGIATGNGFTSGWNNMGVGTGDRVNAWYMKQLFVTVAPVKGVELSWGGLAPVRGESTEITSYDNDGYLLGQRVTFKMPKEMFFDELSVTTGYLGDTTVSSLTDRWHNIDQVNYRHLLVGKRVTKTIAASADYTWLAGVGTLRAAVSAKVPFVVVDSVRWEQYQRMGSAGAFGFSVAGDKAVARRVTVGAGYANIDKNYGGLNADRFNKGRRMFETATIAITRELTGSIFYTHAMHNDYAITNARRLDMVLSLNAVTALKRAGVLH